MKKLWGKILKNSRLMQDTTVFLEGEMDEADMFVDVIGVGQDGLRRLCNEFDIETPMWLEPNKREFMRYEKTRFRAANFVDEIGFDYLEIEIIE